MRIPESDQQVESTLDELSTRIGELRQRNDELVNERVEVEARLKEALAETRRREEETRWLLQGAEAVLECHTFEEAARRIFDAARAVTGAVSGYVALLSESGAENEVLFLEAGGLPCDVDPSLPMPIRGLRAVAYAEARTVYDNDFENSEWVEFMPPGHVAMHNVLFAPLTIDDRVVGVMGLANKSADFTAADVRIARAFGDMAAIALRRMQAEEALRESEKRYRLITQVTNDVIWDWDLVEQTLRWSDGFATRFGYEPNAVKRTIDGWVDRVHPEDRERVVSGFYAVVEGSGTEWRDEYRYRRADGSYAAVVDRGILILGADGRPVRMIGGMTDITEQKRAEEALRESEERYRGLVERSLQGVVIAQASPVRIAFASKPMEAITGFSPEELMSFSPQQLADLIHPRHREAFFQNFRARVRGEDVPPRRDYRFVHKDGRVRWVEIYSSRIEYNGEPATQTVFLDITARKESEAKLQEYAHLLEEMVERKVYELEQERAKIVQMDKMAAVGQLATGVAHELNQPLTAITFEADFLRQMAQRAKAEGCSLEEVLTPDQLEQVGSDILGDLARCRRIIDHVREFSRLSRGRPRTTNVNQVIEDSFILTRERLRNQDVSVELDLQEGLPLIMVDPHRLEQVFLNLIANAEHALQQRSAENPNPGYQKVLHIATFSSGEDVVVTFCDNGCGIPEDVQKRIFDPFFTTKPVGEGTGLGLSISYGIVTEYDGEITCQSTEGEGTRFTLLFPVAEG